MTLRQGSIVPLSRQPRCQGFDAAQASPCQQGTAAPRRGEKRLETFELLTAVDLMEKSHGFHGKQNGKWILLLENPMELMDFNGKKNHGFDDKKKPWI